MFSYISVISFVLVGLSRAQDRPHVHTPKEVSTIIKAAAEECALKDHNIPELLDLVGNGKYKDEQDFKELVFCSFVKAGFADPKTGHVIHDSAAAVFEHDPVLYKAMTDCDIAGSTPVETTNLSFKCFLDNTPKLVKLQ